MAVVGERRSPPEITPSWREKPYQNTRNGGADRGGLGSGNLGKNNDKVTF